MKMIEPKNRDELKRLYDAARAYQGDTILEAAAKIGKSRSTIEWTLTGKMTSRPAIKGVINYIKSSGIELSESTIRQLDSIIPSTKNNQQAV